MDSILSKAVKSPMPKDKSQNVANDSKKRQSRTSSSAQRPRDVNSIILNNAGERSIRKEKQKGAASSSQGIPISSLLIQEDEKSTPISVSQTIKPKKSKNKTKGAVQDAALTTSAPMELDPIPEANQMQTRTREEELARHNKDLRREAKRRRKARAAGVGEVHVVNTASHPRKTIASSNEDGTDINEVLMAKKPREKWRLSQPVGGCFANIKPLFSRDEKFLLLVQSSYVRVYSTKTSLLARSLSVTQPPQSPFRSNRIPPLSNIVGLCFHPNEAEKLYTLTSIGELWLWNWLEGTLEGWWSLDVSKQGEIGRGGIHITRENEDDTLWMTTLVGKDTFLYNIKLSAPVRKSKGENPLSTAIIHQVHAKIRALQVLDGRTFVMIAGDKIYIGNRYRKLQENGQWGVIREIIAENKLMCLDVLMPRQDLTTANSKNKKEKTSGNGDIAVGDTNGVIYVYHGVVEVSSEFEPVARRLHWHRSAVASVRWALDGTYLISGGKETVLVIWQISTSGQQFLPHLAATIEDIVVAPRGQNSYAIKLGDNSVIIISTTELKPKTHIAGLQARVYTGFNNDEELNDESSWNVPCIIHPQDSNQVLLAAPTSQLEGSSSPFLQTYDVASDRGISRQALTRTLVSSKNISPEGSTLREPDIKFMSISSDGSWLATVDEWAAPAIDFVDASAPKPPSQAIVLKEVFLRFWQWSNSQWELVTRIDSPHSRTSAGSSIDVTDLIASPATLSFTTVGNDGAVKVWRPRARTRAGVKIEKEGVYVWGCHKIIEVTKSMPDDFVDAKITYSADGSVLALSTTEEEEAVVHIINPFSGTIPQLLSSLQNFTIFALAFIGHNLVIAGDQRLTVWDLVTGRASWSIDIASLLPDYHLDNGKFIRNILLASDQTTTNTFAISINHPRSNSYHVSSIAKNTTSTVLVFAVDSHQPLSQISADKAVVALKSLSCGYMYLDGASTLHFLSPQSAITTARGIPDATEIQDAYLNTGGIGNAYMNQKTLPEPDAITSALDDMNEDDLGSGKIVRADMVARLFPAPPYAANALADVFDRFMTLVAEKPLAAGAIDDDDEDKVEQTSTGLLPNGVKDDEDEEMDDANEVDELSGDSEEEEDDDE